MKKLTMIIATVLIILSASAFSDSEIPDALWEEGTDSRVASVDSKQYVESCGHCHDAYPAGLMLPQSWEKIVLDLDKHFGEKVILNDDSKKEVLNYLLSNAVGRSAYILSSRLMEGLQDEQPIRITRLPFFIDQHKGLSGNLSACSSCHSKVLEGLFNK